MDIEDLGADSEGAGIRSIGAIVAPKVNMVRDVAKRQQARRDAVPGTQMIWTKTFGCAHNVSDGEYMVGMLRSYGYAFTADKGEADLWLINSCTVKDPSQAAFMNLVQSGKAAGKGLVVSGCVPQGERTLKGLEGVSMVGVQQVDRVVDVVEETLRGNVVRMLTRGRLPRLDLPKIRKNRLVEIVPISTGCLGSCTYCKTKHARGDLGSYETSALVDRVRAVVKEGVTEVWLSSEDTGAYGRDIGTDVPTLLDALLQTAMSHGVEPPAGEAACNAMLRLGMTNPPYILEHLPAVALALRHPRAFEFLHVPVQSGSDSVLKGMNREYTVCDFETVCDYLFEHVPGITISTDIICGFPGETDEHWVETMRLVRKYRFHILNISQFYARQGTPAARMRRVHSKVVKSRSKEISALLDTFTPYAGMEGSVHRVWANTEVDSTGRYTVAHTKNYTKVLVPRDDTLMGASAEVEVVSVARWHVVAKILSRGYPSPNTLKLLGAAGAQGWVDGQVVAGGVMGGAADSCGSMPGKSNDDGDYGEGEEGAQAANATDVAATHEAGGGGTVRTAANWRKGARRPWGLIFSLFFAAFAIVVAKFMDLV